jgi:hypothetical protein
MQPTSMPLLTQNYLTLHCLISRMVKVVLIFFHFILYTSQIGRFILIFFVNIRLAIESHDYVASLFLNVSLYHFLNIKFFLSSIGK